MTKKKKKCHSFFLGRRHHFSSISLYSTASNKVPALALNTDICCLSNRTRWKNTILVHFIHCLVHLHLSSCVLYVSEGHEKTSTPLTRWRCDGEAYSSKFIPTSDPPLSCCQNHLQITTTELTDILYTHRLILKWDFGSFRLKYC